MSCFSPTCTFLYIFYIIGTFCLHFLA
jgi:hypothetical protein